MCRGSQLDDWDVLPTACDGRLINRQIDGQNIGRVHLGVSRSMVIRVSHVIVILPSVVHGYAVAVKAKGPHHGVHAADARPCCYNMGSGDVGIFFFRVDVL